MNNLLKKAWIYILPCLIGLLVIVAGMAAILGVIYLLANYWAMIWIATKWIVIIAIVLVIAYYIGVLILTCLYSRLIDTINIDENS
jgi:hypothetical protein